jgi:hypothetical protein
VALELLIKVMLAVMVLSLETTLVAVEVALGL